VEFAFEEQLEQLFEPGGFGNINELAGSRDKVSAAASFEAHGIEVLDVNDAQGSVQVAFFAQRESGISGLFCDFQTFGNTGFGIESGNFLAGTHHLAGNAPSQIKSVEDNVAAQYGCAGLLLRSCDYEPQFFLGMGAIAFAGSEAHRPSELWYMSSPDAAPKRLTSFNDPVAALDLGAVESFEWQGPDGLNEDGVIIKPPGFDPARKYPLVLLIHGGPQAASTETFSPLGQSLAARGWVVFQPNYRGTDRYGWKHYSSSFRQWGLESPRRSARLLLNRRARSNFCFFDASLGGRSFQGCVSFALSPKSKFPKECFCAGFVSKLFFHRQTRSVSACL